MLENTRLILEVTVSLIVVAGALWATLRQATKFLQTLRSFATKDEVTAVQEDLKGALGQMGSKFEDGLKRLDESQTEHHSKMYGKLDFLKDTVAEVKVSQAALSGAFNEHIRKAG